MLDILKHKYIMHILLALRISEIVWSPTIAPGIPSTNKTNIEFQSLRIIPVSKWVVTPIYKRYKCQKTPKRTGRTANTFSRHPREYSHPGNNTPNSHPQIITTQSNLLHPNPCFGVLFSWRV